MAARRSGGLGLKKGEPRSILAVGTVPAIDRKAHSIVSVTSIRFAGGLSTGEICRLICAPGIGAGMKTVTIAG